MNFRSFECCGKRLDNCEWVYGAYVPEYTLNNPNEGGCIVSKKYGIQYPVDPKTVEFVKLKNMETFCKQNALKSVYLNVPDTLRDIKELWVAIMKYGEIDPEPLRLRDEFDNKRHDEIIKSLQILFQNAKELVAQFN